MQALAKYTFSSMLVFLGVCAFTTGHAEAQRHFEQKQVAPVEATRKHYWSPNHKLQAIVISLKPRSYGDPESKLEIRSANGHLLARTSYASPTGAQGYFISKSRWTRDSRFFVYETESSGGHSPWHHPTHFYSTTHHKIYSLDHTLGNHKPASDKGDGAITTRFVLKSPHTLLAAARRYTASPGVRIGNHQHDSYSTQDILHQPPLTIDMAVIDTLVTAEDAEKSR